ncbi:fimbrial assembly chaperone [Limnobaculum zhutongyuii]|uniref:Fimbrial assembly chaperone n=1 Tax=Limnobaculum zhutongyuii TaxID=2498113 RepID=A0A411WKP3_9GAMM|nr:fimbrial assembly chaperone [Limnobaculum zhutongyuii]QBH96705.1 fimbrial assembly chaperone [Limnobaculum zhutongyuii]TQS90263.1 fimbrial assembly chaperone [Limnobaculum zhutongyuii]
MKLLWMPILFSLYITTIFQANASVVIGGTRVIFDGSKKETSVSLENKDNVANLVQSWITPADADTPSKDAIIITPPLFRLDAGDKNVLRIVRSGTPMPEDRESMYWLNVKGIPSVNKNTSSNSLQIAINSRVKLIYRPVSLKETMPESLTQQLVWGKSGNRITVNNPTPYYMNFAQIKVNGRAVPDVTYVAPRSQAIFQLHQNTDSGKVSWRILNDYGMAGAEHSATF